MDSELVGLKNVKTRVREISSVLLFDRIREIQELGALNSSLHMSFTGRPGTGKTSVANKIALVLRNLGYLTKGHLTNVTREDLVGQYVGHTAPKTREQLKRAQGGILFIDEAHHLYKPDNERDYGSEAVELLLQVMENQRDDLILIFSGQKEKLETFYNCNPGVSSRIGNHVNFEDYNVQELTEITSFILNNEKRYKFDEKTIELLLFYIQQLVVFPAFANVRTIKIFLNQLLSYQAIRVENTILKTGEINYKELAKSTGKDMATFNNPKSRDVLEKDLAAFVQAGSSPSAVRTGRPADPNKAAAPKDKSPKLKITNPKPKSTSTKLKDLAPADAFAGMDDEEIDMEKQAIKAAKGNKRLGIAVEKLAQVSQEMKSLAKAYQAAKGTPEEAGIVAQLKDLTAEKKALEKKTAPRQMSAADLMGGEDL